jgi:hypothetical protein
VTVSVDEIREVLTRAAAVRMPRFTPEMHSRERVEILEDYLNLTAVARGELEEARLWAHMALRDLTQEWDDIKGWGMHLQGNGRHTKDDVVAAKREVRPELHDGIKEAKWLVERLTDQIDRIGARMGDDQVASRIYTLIAG